MFRWLSWQVFAAILCLAATVRAEDEPAEKPIPAPAGGKPVQGTLLIANKSYKFAHVAVYETKVFDDDGYSVLLSASPIPVDKLKASLRDGKGKDDNFIFFQPHVKVTFRKSGEVMFCNAYADGSSVSVSGTKLTGRLVIDAGRARGQTALVADADDKRKDSFDALFDTPLIVVPAPKTEPTPAPKDKPVAKGPASKGKDGKGSDSGEKPVAAVAKFHYLDLPLPKDAADVEYTKRTEQVRYKSGVNYKTLAMFLAQKLAAQGWKAKGSDLLGVSAIMHRNLGDAELTFIIKPIEGGAGCTVWITSKGLSWEDKAPAEDPSEPKPETKE